MKLTTEQKVALQYALDCRIGELKRNRSLLRANQPLNNEKIISLERKRECMTAISEELEILESITF